MPPEGNDAAVLIMLHHHFADTIHNLAAHLGAKSLKVGGAKLWVWVWWVGGHRTGQRSGLVGNSVDLRVHL